MTCATCHHWNPKASGQMSRHRMALCNLGARWTFYPPQHTCPKHKDAAPEIVQGRVTWLAQQPASSNVQRKHGR